MPVLARNEVHVWTIALDRRDWSVSLASALLVGDEVARARRFRFEADRRRFVVCRANLRRILARYLHCGPGDVRFRVTAHGKPFLDPGSHDDPVSFNVAHSHERAIVGVTTIGEVGVDIEHIRSLDDAEAIVAHDFSCRERRTFAGAAPAHRLRTFFRCWTLKEAYLKALGLGLSVPLHAVDFATARQRHVPSTERDRPAAGGAWTVRCLRPGAGYVAALAVRGRGSRIRQRRWAAVVRWAA